MTSYAAVITTPPDFAAVAPATLKQCDMFTQLCHIHVQLIAMPHHLALHLLPLLPLLQCNSMTYRPGTLPH